MANTNWDYTSSFWGSDIFIHILTIVLFILQHWKKLVYLTVYLVVVVAETLCSLSLHRGGDCACG